MLNMVRSKPRDSDTTLLFNKTFYLNSNKLFNRMLIGTAGGWQVELISVIRTFKKRKIASQQYGSWPAKCFFHHLFSFKFRVLSSFDDS